jgi:hypothetical protein
MESFWHIVSDPWKLAGVLIPAITFILGFQVQKRLTRYRGGKEVRSAFSSLRLIRERFASEDKESLFGSAAMNPNVKTRLQREVEVTDRQIDQLLYELYFLTQHEIKLVEQ